MEDPTSSSRDWQEEEESEEGLEEEEEFVTPDVVLKRMTESWQNELASPCLLPSKMELVEILLDQIQGMEENIGRQNDKVQLRISVHRMELQRISYMTSDYIRCRLEKIEANPRYILNEHNRRIEEAQSELLSELEIKYATEYAESEAQLFGKTVLGFMPHALQKIPVPVEDLSVEMVYARVVEEDVENVSIPDWTDPNSEVIIELEKDTVHLIPFASIRHLIEDGKMILL